METNMNEAVLILPNMRGGCATVGGKVHTLFRMTGRRKDAALSEQRRVAAPPFAD
jgi:hypothetical protein